MNTPQSTSTLNAESLIEVIVADQGIVIKGPTVTLHTDDASGLSQLAQDIAAIRSGKPVPTSSASIKALQLEIVVKADNIFEVAILSNGIVIQARKESPGFFTSDATALAQLTQAIADIRSGKTTPVNPVRPWHKTHSQPQTATQGPAQAQH